MLLQGMKPFKIHLKNDSKLNALLWFKIGIILLAFFSNYLEAQIIYDSPSIGVSIARPVLPWLARYFVNAGNKKIYFLDEPQKGPMEDSKESGQIGGETILGGDMATRQKSVLPQQESINQITPQQNMANSPQENYATNGAMINEYVKVPEHMENMDTSRLEQPESTDSSSLSVISSSAFSAKNFLPAVQTPYAPRLLPPQTPSCASIKTIMGQKAAVTAKTSLIQPTVIPITPVTSSLFPCSSLLLTPSELPEPLPIIPEGQPMPVEISLTEILQNLQPTFSPTLLTMNGSPKPSNPNFSYRNAVLDGVTPPTVKVQPSKFMTTLRRFTG